MVLEQKDYLYNMHGTCIGYRQWKQEETPCWGLQARREVAGGEG